MDCAEAQPKLLDSAEGELSEQEQSLLAEHLAGCSQCRAEFQRLRTAAAAVCQATDDLAPLESYLTAERLDRLMAAYAHGRKTIRLITYRGLVAAAAVAVILVSGAFIAQSLVSMFRAAEPMGPGPIIAAGRSFPPAIPVVLAFTSQDEPMRVIRSLTVQGEGQPVWEGRPVRFVGTNSAGLRVPVNHVFYDPEESSHWW